MYLTFEEYQSMGGTLNETAYNTISIQVDAIIDYKSFNRLQKETYIGLDVKNCAFALTNLVNTKLNLFDSTQTKEIASQSNDGVSISYNVLSATDMMSRYNFEVNTIIQMYLHNTTNKLGQRILYRGLYPNE